MTFAQARDAIDLAEKAYGERDTTATIRAITAAVIALQEVQGPLLIHGDDHFTWLAPPTADPGSAHPTVFTPGLTQVVDEPHRLTLDELVTPPPPPLPPLPPAFDLDMTPPTTAEAFRRYIKPAPLVDPALRVDMPGPIPGPFLDDDATDRLHITGGTP
jgi:hypothetical protein